MRYSTPVNFRKRALYFSFCLFFASCAIKRPTPDFKELEELETVNSSPVEPPSDAQMEFPVTPGASAPSQEGTRSKRPGIALVVGGAGVASFGTVGLLKRLKTEGIKVDLLIASGWPALFALGYGFFKSVHDLEWFAMRLQEADFKKAGYGRKENDLGTVSKLIESFLKKNDLKDSKVPLLVIARDPDGENLEVFESGDWNSPLLKALAVPGLYREASEKNVKPIPLGVEEARKRFNGPIFVVQMYSDYWSFLKEKGSWGEGFQRELKQEASQADMSFEIKLGDSPLHLSQKRAAILAGSRIAGQITNKISK